MLAKCRREPFYLLSKNLINKALAKETLAYIKFKGQKSF